jgi:hypothetical protein
MRYHPGIAIEVSEKKCTCTHADGTTHFVEIGELVMVQYHYRPGQGKKLFRTVNSLCCVDKNQATAILGGATSNGYPITMDALEHAHYAVAMAILGERSEDRLPKPVHKLFRLVCLKSNV